MKPKSLQEETPEPVGYAPVSLRKSNPNGIVVRALFVLAMVNFVVNTGMLGYQCLGAGPFLGEMLDLIGETSLTRFLVSLFLLLWAMVMCFIPRFRCARTYIALVFLLLSLPLAVVLVR